MSFEIGEYYGGAKRSSRGMRSRLRDVAHLSLKKRVSRSMGARPRGMGARPRRVSRSMGAHPRRVKRVVHSRKSVKRVVHSKKHKLTIPVLKSHLRALGVKGYSKLRKAELVKLARDVGAF
jgi:hypothetical protein